MDTGGVLKKAWHYVWRYRALWMFGIVLALTTFSWGWATLGDLQDGNSPLMREWQPSPADRAWLKENLGWTLPANLTVRWRDMTWLPGTFLEGTMEPGDVASLFAIAWLLVLAVLALIVISAVARYVSETALIRMVDDYEETQQVRRVRDGLRLGWTRAAWRLFVIDVIIFLGTFALVIALYLPAIFPVLMVIERDMELILFGALVATVMAFTAIALSIVVVASSILLSRLAHQACAVDGLGVIASIRQAFNVVRHNLKEVAPIWVAMIGVDLTYPLLVAPIAIVLVGMGLAVGGIVAAGVGSLATWILAGIVGVVLFLLILAVPMAFLGGLREVFQSSAWTLTYRELRTLEDKEPQPKSTPIPAPA